MNHDLDGRLPDQCQYLELVSCPVGPEVEHLVVARLCNEERKFHCVQDVGVTAVVLAGRSMDLDLHDIV